MGKTNFEMEALHYIFVYLVILGTWLPLMTYFKNDVILTAATSFLVFVIADQIAHRTMLNEKFIMNMR